MYFYLPIIRGRECSTWHRKQEICFNFSIFSLTVCVHLTDYAFHQHVVIFLSLYIFYFSNIYPAFTCYTSRETREKSFFQLPFFLSFPCMRAKIASANKMMITHFLIICAKRFYSHDFNSCIALRFSSSFIFC